MTISTLAQAEQPITFSASDYSNNPARVIKHASETGKAIVAAEDGRPLVVILIRTEEQSTLDD